MIVIFGRDKITHLLESLINFFVRRRKPWSGEKDPKLELLQLFPHFKKNVFMFCFVFFNAAAVDSVNALEQGTKHLSALVTIFDI